MKTLAGVSTIALCFVFANGLNFMGTEQPAGDDQGDASAAGDGDNPPPLNGPAHKDNFQDEILDQADPEFDMVSGGDGCVSWEDMQKTLQEQFQEGAPDLDNLSDAEKAEMDEVKRQMEQNMRMMCENADTNGDDCIDKAEFEAAGELEGPPPGFQKKKIDDMGEEAFTDEMLREDRMEFDAMDRNGDGKISKSESFHYASENMDGADINDEDMNEMFDVSDTDGDGFITWEEFEGAGEEIDGDGNEMEDATPMSFKIMIQEKKLKTVRAQVTKRLLAHSPPLKIMSRMLNIAAP